MSRNKLFMLPKRCFAPFAKLAELSLCHNSLSSLDFLDPLINLVVLDVSYNELREFSKEKIVLKELAKLNLGSNKITETKNMEKMFPKLIILDLSENQLSSENQFGCLKGMLQLNEIYINGNPCFSDELCQKLLDGYESIDQVDDFERLKPSTGSLVKTESSAGGLGEDQNLDAVYDSDLLLIEKEFNEIFYFKKIAESKNVCEKSLMNISEAISNCEEKLTLKKIEVYEESKCIRNFAERVFNTHLEVPRSMEFIEKDPTDSLSIRKSEEGSVKERQTSIRVMEEEGSVKVNERGNSTVRPKGLFQKTIAKAETPFRIKTLKGSVKFTDKVHPRILMLQNAKLKEFMNLNLK
jgi:hypothetical protein